MEKYIENIASIEKSIEELKAHITPEEQTAAQPDEEEPEAPAPVENKSEGQVGLDEDQLDELAAAADRPRGETKVCPVCHAEGDADALFCNHCGAQL